MEMKSGVVVETNFALLGPNLFSVDTQALYLIQLW